MRNVSRAVGSMLLSLAFGAACGETPPPDTETSPPAEATGEAEEALCEASRCSLVRGHGNDRFLTALRLGERGEGAVSAIAAAHDGGVWVAGWFAGTLDVGGERIAAAGGRDGFVARLDGCGAVEWAQALGGEGDDEVLDLEVDRLGHGYVLLPFAGTVDVGGTPVTGGGLGRDALVLSLDRDGRARWSELVHTTDGGAFPSSLAIDAVGDVMLLGSLEGELWLGDVRLRSGVVRSFLAWLDGDLGRTQRAGILETATDWVPIDVEASPLGGAFVAGHDARGVGVFAVHVAATGDVVWRSSFRAPRQFDEVFHDLAVDDDGLPVLLAQGFLGEPGVPGAAPPHLVTKLDDRGEPLWMQESEDPWLRIEDGPAGDLVAVGSASCRGVIGRPDGRCSEVLLGSIDDEGDGTKSRRVLRGASATALDVTDAGAAIVAGTASEVHRPARCSTALAEGDLFVARPGTFVGRPGAVGRRWAVGPADAFVPAR